MGGLGLGGLRSGGLGLGEKVDTDEAHRLNQRSRCTSGSVKRFDVPSCFSLYSVKTFLLNRTQEITQSRMFQKTLNQFKQGLK